MPIQLTDAMLDAATNAAINCQLTFIPPGTRLQRKIREVVQAALDAMPSEAVPFADPKPCPGCGGRGIISWTQYILRDGEMLPVKDGRVCPQCKGTGTMAPGDMRGANENAPGRIESGRGQRG